MIMMMMILQYVTHLYMSPAPMSLNFLFFQNLSGLVLSAKKKGLEWKGMRLFAMRVNRDKDKNTMTKCTT